MVLPFLAVSLLVSISACCCCGPLPAPHLETYGRWRELGRCRRSEAAVGEPCPGSVCGKELPQRGGSPGPLRVGPQCAAAGARGQRRAGGRPQQSPLRIPARCLPSPSRPFYSCPPHPGPVSCAPLPRTAPCFLMAQGRKLLFPVSRCPDRDEGAGSELRGFEETFKLVLSGREPGSARIAG